MKVPELIEKFSSLNNTDMPDFYSYTKPLERGLWVLWTAKEKLDIKKMTAEEIAAIIRDVYEISIDNTAILRSFSKSGDKIHTYRDTENIYYEIMKPGKEHLLSLVREGSINIFYFAADKPFTSKRLLSKHIFDTLNGDLSFVDPYCGMRTLDILSNIKKRKILFLTKTDNLREPERGRFLRELRDFKTEHTNVEFRNYPNTDLHDRYIISSDSLVIIGHSVKDLGSKESFAVILNNTTSKNLIEALIENFNRRWKQAATL
jgi:hypothetical protein